MKRLILLNSLVVLFLISANQVKAEMGSAGMGDAVMGTPWEVDGEMGEAGAVILKEGVIDQNVGIGVDGANATSKLTVNGMIESKAGGIKFPDGTIQSTALGTNSEGVVEVTEVHVTEGLKIGENSLLLGVVGSGGANNTISTANQATDQLNIQTTGFTHIGQWGGQVAISKFGEPINSGVRLDVWGSGGFGVTDDYVRIGNQGGTVGNSLDAISTDLGKRTLALNASWQSGGPGDVHIGGTSSSANLKVFGSISGNTISSHDQSVDNLKIQSTGFTHIGQWGGSVAISKFGEPVHSGGGISLDVWGKGAFGITDEYMIVGTSAFGTAPNKTIRSGIDAIAASSVSGPTTGLLRLNTNAASGDVQVGAGAKQTDLFVYGNVGIGTDNLTDGATTYQLSVDGKIRAEEVKVYTGWADYVFEDDYQLRSLNDVENYIQENGHLPDIPSAVEVENSGVELGEMQKLAMQKIEELTLYMIELEKKNVELEEKLETLLTK